jgi:hypothetical protein
MTAKAEPGTSRSPRLSATGGPLWIAGAAVAGIIVGFLAAYAWQSPRTSRLRHTAEYASRALPAARLEATLAAAVIATQDGQYEIGRQRASAFFTGFQRRVAPTLSDQPGDASRQLLARRDEIITALARSDPASPSVLGQTLARYRELVRQAGLDSAVSGATR